MEVDGVRYEEIKGQIKKKYTKTVINILKPKLNRGDIILGTNSRAISIIRYGAGIISWTTIELVGIHWKTRKLMTMYRAQHPKADVDRLYLQRCE